MPIHVSWSDASKTIILAEYEGSSSLEDYHAMIDTMHAMVVSVDHTVHFISDFTRNRTAPAKLFSTGRHIESRLTPNSGINVIVNINGISKTILQVARRMFLKDIPIYLADSLEEAYQIIHEYQSAAT